MIKQLRQLLAWLRSLLFLHWTAHWQATGPHFNADHQLFERLYLGDDDDDTTIIDEIDALAEKMVSEYGVSAVDLDDTLVEMVKLVSQISGKGAERCLRAEVGFLDALKNVYKQLERSNALSMGMDDLLQSIANKHETHVYLLRRRVASKG